MSSFHKLKEGCVMTLTRNEVAKELKRLGWKVKSRMWYPPAKRGYCEIWREAKFGEGGINLRSAASYESLMSSEDLS